MNNEIRYSFKMQSNPINYYNLSCYRTSIFRKYYTLIIVLCQDKRGAFMARIIDGNEMNMVGSRVRELRLARKMSQQTLSNKLEMLAIYICRGSISRIEDRQRTVTDIELYGLAKVLHVSVEELFQEAKD